MKEQHYQKCQDITQKLNLEYGLFTTIKHYNMLHERMPSEFAYPNFKFENFKPPFGVFSEIDFTFSHINIILSREYNPTVHNRLFNAKRAVEENLMRIEFERKRSKRITSNEFNYHPDQKQVYHPQHKNLWHVLLSTECATITEIKPEGPTVSWYQAKIRANDEDIVDKLAMQAQYQAPDHHDQYSQIQNYTDILQQKAYESVAWAGESAGTKRFAAAAFLHSCADKKFTIDIVSKTGIYSRIEKDMTRKDKEITITHVVPQRANKFKGLQIPSSWGIGQSEKFVLHCIEYTRNKSYSLTEQWVDITNEWIANPLDTSQQAGIKTNKIKK